MHVGIRRGDAVGEEDTVEHRDGCTRFPLGIEIGQPRVGLTLGGERHGIHDRRARDGHRRRLGCGGSRTRPAPVRPAQPQLRSPAGPQRAEHHYALGLRTVNFGYARHPGRSACAQQVASIGRPQFPGELQLDEEEQSLGHRCTVSLQPMSDASKAVKGLRERLSDGTEDRLGKALTDFLENPVLTGVVGRAFDAREKAAQAQEVAMGALNIPSAADIERFTRRLRSVSQRLEGIEDGVHRLDRALTGRGVDRSEISQRLSAIEDQLGTLTQKLGKVSGRAPAAKASKPARIPETGRASKPAARRSTKPPPKQNPRRPERSGGEGGDGDGRPSPRPPGAGDRRRCACACRGVERVGDDQHTGDGHRCGGSDREQRGCLHLDRERIGGMRRASPARAS